MEPPSPYIDPLELLTNKDLRQPTFLSNIYSPLSCSLLGFACACAVNWGFRKPIISGIQKHITYSLIGGAAGAYLDKKRSDHLATRDAILRHYVELHPEDFPKIERKKYADILEEWVPIR